MVEAITQESIYEPVADDLQAVIAEIATIADRDGMSNARSVPVTADIARMCQGSIDPLWISTPVPSVTTANMSRVNRTIVRRLNRSARTPPHMEKINTGNKFAVATSPSISSDPVSDRIRNRRPYTSDHIPILENAAAIQNRRYSRNLNAE